MRTPARVVLGVIVAAGLLAALSGVIRWWMHDDEEPPPTVDDLSPVAPLPPTRVIAGLDNVENSLFAFDAVWAVTSSRADEISPGPFRASVVRIEPATGQTDVVLDGLAVEPTLACSEDRVWVALDDELVALGANGTEVASISLAGGSGDGLAAAGGRLWVVDSERNEVTVVDPDDPDGRFAISTGEFPVEPVAAFGRVWIPGLIDGSVAIIDESVAASDEALLVRASRRPKNLMPVAGRSMGSELWVSNLNGELAAVSAETERVGELRSVVVERSINRVVALGDRAVALPTWGLRVFGLDLESGRLGPEIALDSIPVRGLAAHGLIWVTSDGPAELLTVIDPETLTVLARFRVGRNESDTNGPQQPFVVGDEVWVPNRGDDAIAIIHLDDVP